MTFNGTQAIILFPAAGANCVGTLNTTIYNQYCAIAYSHYNTSYWFPASNGNGIFLLSGDSSSKLTQTSVKVYGINF